jgi:methionine synthase II (cobalamin-independent)
MTAIATTVVGSYPQPDWLVDKAQFQSNAVPRVRMRQVRRPSCSASST